MQGFSPKSQVIEFANDTEWRIRTGTPRNHWATAQRLLKSSSDAGLTKVLSQSVRLHETLVERERCAELTAMGLELERDFYLQKLRDIDAFIDNYKAKISQKPREAQFLEDINIILRRQNDHFRLSPKK
jgi:hypothetical protein